MQNWKKILFGNKKERQKFLDFLATVPGPSPWALRTGLPVCGRFKWAGNGDTNDTAGKSLLVDESGNVLLALHFQNYVLEMSENKILVWRQDHEKKIISEPVKFILFDLDKLKPLSGELAEIYKNERLNSDGIYFNGQPEMQFEIATSLVNQDVECHFPEQIRTLGELFVLCNSTGIRAADYKMSNLGLMVINFRENKFHIYPQEWFNKGSFDFGYQWITKMGREPESGEIIGQGVRIGSFILKSDYSGIKKVL